MWHWYIVIQSIQFQVSDCTCSIAPSIWPYKLFAQLHHHFYFAETGAFLIAETLAKLHINKPVDSGLKPEKG